MIPVTCTYWRNSSCIKGDRCTYLHGFMCRNDGGCSDPSCNRKHFKQRDPCTYLKPRGSRNRYRSRSRSPYSRKSSSSPYSRRRSPRKRSRTPRKSYSPRRSRSRSYSSSGRSHRKSSSPYRKTDRRSKSRSTRSSRSDSSPTYSPTKSVESPREKARILESPRDKKEKKGLSKDKLKLILAAEKNLDKALDNRNNCDNLREKKETDDAMKIEIESTSKPVRTPETSETHEESVDSPHKNSSGSLSPSMKALEILRNLPKDFCNLPKVASIKEKEEPSVSKVTEDDLFNEAFCKALNKGRESEPSEKSSGNNSTLPPVLKHPLNAENLAKPFHEKLYNYEHQSNTVSNLWTPALDRTKIHNTNNQLINQPISNWEIDTPYVGSFPVL